MLTALDSPDHIALRQALDDLLDRPPLTRRARHPAARGLERPAQRQAAASGDDRRARRRRRHRPAHRPQGRRAPALRQRGDRQAPAGAEEAAERLGHHQDVVVARPALRELAATADNGFSFGVLRGRDDGRAAALEAALPDLWQRARKRIG